MDFGKVPPLPTLSLRKEVTAWGDIDWVALAGRLVINAVIWIWPFAVVCLLPYCLIVAPLLLGVLLR